MATPSLSKTLAYVERAFLHQIAHFVENLDEDNDDYQGHDRDYARDTFFLPRGLGLKSTLLPFGANHAHILASFCMLAKQTCIDPKLQLRDFEYDPNKLSMLHAPCTILQGRKGPMDPVDNDLLSRSSR